MLMDDIRATKSEPQFHGNGFIKLELDGRWLHAWHPDLPPTITNGLIHDHKFTFKSEVKKGWLLHEVWEEGLAGDDYSFWTPEEGEWTDAGSGKLRQMGAYGMGVGSRYAFPAGRFHKVVATRCLTVMDKVPSEIDVDTCRVASDWPGPPEDAFRNDVSVSDMWRCIFDLVMSDG